MQKDYSVKGPTYELYDTNDMNRTYPSATSLTPVKTPDEILPHTAFASVSMFSPILGSLESVF